MLQHTVTFRSLTKPREIPKPLSRSIQSDDIRTSRVGFLVLSIELCKYRYQLWLTNESFFETIEF